MKMMSVVGGAARERALGGLKGRSLLALVPTVLVALFWISLAGFTRAQVSVWNIAR